MSPGFFYVSESFQAVLKPWIPPPMITTFAFEGNDVMIKYNFFLKTDKYNKILFKTKIN